MKPKLVFKVYDVYEYQDRFIDACYISDVLWDSGFDIDDVEAFKAWKAGNLGVWDNPRHFTGDDIVECILLECDLVDDTIEPKDEDIIGLPQSIMDMSDTELEEYLEVGDYEPKSEPRIEGDFWEWDYQYPKGHNSEAP